MDSIRARESARHERASELFLACVGLAAEDRRALLDQQCAGDEELRREVESLLVESARSDGFLEAPADLNGLEEPPDQPPPEEGIGVAGYRVRRVLGWGSMGVVHLATQDSPRRDVALKILRAEALSPALRKRFRREAELLARLDHPSIAKLYEAGIEGNGAGGRPWFAMEYVAGRPLLEHCAAEHLDVRARLRLFVEICEGVHSAHEQGVVHRDLKPSNLLVDQHGRARILDFGVARLAVPGESSTLLTTAGQLVGTLAYMSPEQAAGDGRRVDRRADVYSLGVLLFELLTGELPQSTSGLDIPEAVRVIREDEPVTLRTLAQHLDLDLETIASTALAKEPERRYASARALALDVRRWLHDEPIEARPPSLVYQVTKLARRHRGLVAGAATSIVALSVALVISLFALERARVAEGTLRRELGESQRLSDLRGVQLLERQVDRLWPATSERIPALSLWLADAEPIAARLEQHRTWLADAQQHNRSTDGDRQVAIELVSALDRFCTPTAGALDVVRGRLEDARSLWSRSIDDHAASWAAAIDAISDPRHPHYHGLRITPQEGLVPLGPDPESGLWEFGVLGISGELPARDPATGRLDFGGNSAVVLVLLAGGECLIGGQKTHPLGPNHDPDVLPHEGPPRTIWLDPFFLSKFETTQGQFRRAFASNTSFWEVGDTPHDITASNRNPVEFLDWFMARDLATRLDLELPTEARWEYAARAGTTTAYWTGDDPRGLLCRENLHESFVDDLQDGSGALPAEPDGYLSHCPTGLLPANPYGLHDMLGNVSEWCLDPYKVRYHDLPLREGDGLVLATSPDRDRSLRGGNYGGGGAGLTRSCARTDHREEFRSTHVGVRLARSLR